ncbi:MULTISPECIES: alpha-glucosidase [Salimicrobium]|uniref:Alpha-amylase n=1 Tax=Salimicrobium humidisoli TaxID=2029857 RepID=A0ABX4HNT3_9BACI|nr:MULTISPECIES: alpha-glucosidase [Salimicrobium]PBB04872.1 glucohydrolase [Salimicrobium humidisoli]
MERKWWKEAVGYQVYPRSFQDSDGDGIGDLQGMISRLDYLKDLGIDFIWICPMYKSPLDDNGYDISDYKDILQDFGTMKDFDQLLEEVHNRDMRLIIDLVLNHTSDEHPWFLESKSSKQSPKRDWYIWRDGRDGGPPNNWESIFDGSAWKYDEATDQYFLHIFSERQPDLNWENGEVRRELYDTVNWWLDKGIDGFRIDAISHIKKRPGLPDMPNPEQRQYVSSFDMHMNQEGIHEFLQEFKEETYGKYDAVSVGEANGVSADEAHLWVGDEGKMDMIFQFEHLDLWDREGGTGLDVPGLKLVLTKWQKGLEGDGWNALFIENHDKARAVSTWGDDGELWKESATSLATMYFLMQGTPFIYQGQEIGMTNAGFTSINDYDDVAAKNFYTAKKAQGWKDEEILQNLRETSRDNSRTPMQWENSRNAGFTSGRPWIKINPDYKQVNVEDQKEDETSILNYYRQLIRLKKSYDLFTYGKYDLLEETDPSLYAYTRTLGNQQAVIIANLSGTCSALPPEADIREEDLLLHNYRDLPDESIIRPFEARVYKREW